MSHHDHALPALPPPLRLPTLLRVLALVAALVGAAALAWAFGSGQHDVAWSAWLMGSFFALGLGAFGVAWIAITTLSRGVWAVGMRRVPEAMSAWLLPGGLLSLATAAGAHTLFHWSHPEAVAADRLLAHKAAFLNLPMFLGLVGASFALWVLFRTLIVGGSRKQDTVGGVALSRRNAALSALFLVIFALTLSIVSFYLIMSLEAHWFSTMFAVLIFTDLIQTGLAFAALVVGGLIVRGQLKGFAGQDHFHGLGKMLFASTGFWAYIYFCQFLLIWYANLPEETIYFIKRWDAGWAPYLLVLPVIKFVIPFVWMVPRAHKRDPRRVAPMAALILFAQFWELFVMVGPALGHGEHAAHARLPLVEAAAVAGFLGLFYLVFEWSLARHNPVPLKDPWIRECIEYHG